MHGQRPRHLLADLDNLDFNRDDADQRIAAETFAAEAETGVDAETDAEASLVEDCRCSGGWRLAANY